MDNNTIVGIFWLSMLAFSSAGIIGIYLLIEEGHKIKKAIKKKIYKLLLTLSKI